MILKIWDDRKETEGWIWFDGVRAVKREDSHQFCVALSLEKETEDDDRKRAGIFRITDDSTVDRDRQFFGGVGNLFGSWMFSGTDLVQSFSKTNYEAVKLLTVIYASGDEQVLILRACHPGCYLLSDSGKTIERI